MLDDELIARKLRRLAGWTLHDNKLIMRGYSFPDFSAALAYVNRVGELAEAAGHHPDINLRYNRVSLTLTTHDAGGLTERDFALARQCDKAAEG